MQMVLYRELKSGITSGRFAPGETLTIRSIAAAAGTSVMPVREALQRLVAEGSVEARANRTFAIPRLSLPSVEELYRVRKLLEGMAAAQACERRTPELVRRLRRECQSVKAATEAGRFEAMLQANHRFHFALYEAAESHHLIGIIETLWAKSGPLLRALSETAAAPPPSDDAQADHHDDMLQAFVEGDVPALQRALEADLDIPLAWYRRQQARVADAAV